jgi:hypothetical protein
MVQREGAAFTLDGTCRACKFGSRAQKEAILTVSQRATPISLTIRAPPRPLDSHPPHTTQTRARGQKTSARGIVDHTSGEPSVAGNVEDDESWRAAADRFCFVTMRYAPTPTTGTTTTSIAWRTRRTAARAPALTGISGCARSLARAPHASPRSRVWSDLILSLASTGRDRA